MKSRVILVALTTAFWFASAMCIVSWAGGPGALDDAEILARRTKYQKEYGLTLQEVQAISTYSSDFAT